MKLKECFNIAVLASGSGSNLQAIIDNIKSGKISNASLKLVLSNKKNAFALERAQQNAIAAFSINPREYTSPLEYDAKILQILQDNQIDLIVLAGYLKILTSVLLVPYQQRILNIHPSLLPAFGGDKMYGMKVHEAVIKSGVKYSGCTVHLVTEEIDAGPILDQEIVKVEEEDTPHLLSEKVLKREHILYSRALNNYINQLIKARAK